MLKIFPVFFTWLSISKVSFINAVNRNKIVNKGMITENANDERIVQLVPVFLIELTVKKL